MAKIAPPGEEAVSAEPGTSAPVDIVEEPAAIVAAKALEEPGQAGQIETAETAGTAEEPGPWSRPAEEAEQVAPAAVAKKPDIETALGTRWAVWVGGLALALGGVFLVRYS
ncbi:DUF2339 domain-containing protein, partial [Rhizobiaceae sp. 2RAB30]